MNGALLVLTLSAALMPAPQRRAEAAEPNPASLRGVVVDARTGQPLGEVFVQIVNGGEFALTDEDGRFSFEGLAPGRHESTYRPSAMR